MTKTHPANEWVPSACTLPTVEQPLRLAEFDALFRSGVSRATRIRRTHLELVISPESEAVARDLAGRETSCCSFFQFGFEPATEGELVMAIGVPDEHVDVLDALQARVVPTAGIGNDDA
jgi:hypothetical protein